MRKETRPKLWFALLLSLSCLASAETAPTPEAQQIIKQLGLREASQPISNSKGWKPERVVVIAPSFLTEVVPDFENRLLAVAGDVELVVDSSGKYFPDAGLLADLAYTSTLTTYRTVRDHVLNIAEALAGSK